MLPLRTITNARLVRVGGCAAGCAKGAANMWAVVCAAHSASVSPFDDIQELTAAAPHVEDAEVVTVQFMVCLRGGWC